MGRRVVLALLLAATGLACSGQTTGATPPDAALTTVDGEGATDATGGAPGTLPDGGPICPGPIPNDLVISSLFDLPVALLCGSDDGYPSDGTESMPCEGTIMVAVSSGVDCDNWWLFDAKTGDLEAVGTPCDGMGGCVGAAPGFAYPSQCENSDKDAGGWWSTPGTSLCAGYDAGAEADAGDAADALAADAGRSDASAE
jgi:hypothetical protein